jgi:hypothetical protein
MADAAWTAERLPEARLEWEKFVKRLRRLLGEKHEFAAVWEMQQRGVVHFHCVFFGMPYIQAATLERLWGHGFIRIKDVSDLDFPARYLAKYFVKEFTEGEAANLLAGRPRRSRAWTVSRGVRRPVEHREYIAYGDAVALMEHRMTPRLRQYRDLGGREVIAWRVPKDFAA